MSKKDDLRRKAIFLLSLDLVLAPLVGMYAYNQLRPRPVQEAPAIEEMTPAAKAYEEIMPTDVYMDPVDECEHPEDEAKPNYKIESFEGQDEVSLLARAILGEGENCTLDEKYFIGFVAYNRANDNLRHNGVGLEDALIGKETYFKSFHDINAVKMKDPETYVPKIFQECLKVAEDILEGRVQDPTNGSNAYHRVGHVPPECFNRMQKIGQLPTSKGPSKHIFYLET